MATPDYKTPPHNTDAEESVLGAVLLDKEAIVRVAEIVEPKHFYDERNQMVFTAMLELFKEREPIDVVTVTNQLKKQNALKKVGGTARLGELTAKVPTAAHVDEYAKIVKDMAIKRSLISLSSDLSELAFDPTAETGTILDRAEQEIFGISQKQLDRSFISIKKVLAESFDRLDELQKNAGELRGVPSGFADLDNTLAGMQKSNLLILAARPGIGKTAFSLAIAQYAAVIAKKVVGYFSLEMSKEELVDRLLVSQADIDAWRLKTGRLDEQDFEKLSEAMGVLAEARLSIDDTPGQSILEVRTKARRLMAEQGLDLIIVDYLQLMRGYTTDNRVQEVSEISQGLKNLARELKVPVLALSQLNRAVESRGTKQPQLSDLRESGCVMGDTLVLRSDTNTAVPIETLDGQKNIPVYSMDDHFKMIPTVASKVFATGTKDIFTLTLKSGKSIRATANHKFYTIDGWKRLDELKETDHIATPRMIPELAYVSNTVISDDKLIVLAHLIGDGCFVKGQPLHYTNNDMSLIQAVAESAKNAFGVEGRVVKQQSWFHLYLPSPYRLARGKRNPIVQWLDEMNLYGLHSREKFIPQQIFSLSKEQIALFLKHLWSTDGCVFVKNPQRKGALVSIYYASGSEQLVQQVSHLLLRFGIVSTMRSSKKSGYEDMHSVCIQGKNNQLRFLELIGCAGEKEKIVLKAKQLLHLIKANPNNDVIPKAIWKRIEKLRVGMGLSGRAFHAQLGWAYSGTMRYQNGVSRDRLEKINKLFEDDLLHMFIESDIYWDQVRSIVASGKEKVYDATVPTYHSFLANDVVIHNSIEQDSDVVMFLYREEDEAPEHVKLQIAKHRNGPLRIIDLFFRGDRIKFYGMEQRK